MMKTYYHKTERVIDKGRRSAMLGVMDVYNIMDSRDKFTVTFCKSQQCKSLCDFRINSYIYLVYELSTVCFCTF